MIAACGRDLRFAWRTMRRSPGVTAAAVVALALGIGANTAIFSVVDGVLLRPLPYRAPSELVRIFPGTDRQPRFAASYPEYKDLRDGAPALVSVAAWAVGDINVSGDSAPERARVLFTTPSLFATLGVQPILGRSFLPEEEHKGHEQVVILDYGLWQSRYGGDPRIIGRSIALDRLPYQVVGVMPRGFMFHRPADLYVPLSTAMDGIDQRGSVFLNVVARRARGVSAAQLQASLDVLAHRLRELHPKDYEPSRHWRLEAVPLGDVVVGNVRLTLLVLLGAVACVLLIACANVANLLLARTASRAREMAVRVALGARRSQIVRQLLTESVVLGLAGGALGLLLAVWGIDALVALSPDTLPRAGEVHLDARVLGFSLAVSLATGIGFGLMPALSASRPDLHGALKDGTRGSTATHRRLRRALVVVEVAVSLLLLVGAGLMVRSFARLRSVDPGFRVDHLLSLRVSLPTPPDVETKADRDRYVAFFARAQERLAALPGVHAVGGATLLPFARSAVMDSFVLEGWTPPASGVGQDSNTREVLPGYFETMNIPLVRGRVFTAADGAAAPLVVVVNQAFARRFWPGGEDPVGKRLRLDGDDDKRVWTIVGIVGDMHSLGLATAPEHELYFAHAQLRRASALSLVLRTEGDPKALAGAARAAIGEVDPSQPIFDVRPLDEVLSDSLTQRRFTLTLMLVFGLVALVLAAVGIYGVMAYTVAQRTQEIGIRMALGARPATVLSMVLREGMTLVALGLVLGTAAALALGRLVASLLYDVSATDPSTYAIIAAALAAVAVAAIVLPARRAMRVDPMQALRSE